MVSVSPDRLFRLSPRLPFALGLRTLGKVTCVATARNAIEGGAAP